MKARFGLLVAVATLTVACARDDSGTHSVITGTTSEGIIHSPSLAGSYGGEVISAIQIIDLGTLPGGTNSTAADINDGGDIVGTSETLSGEAHAFILSGSLMTDLGTFPGGDRSSATGINNLRDVVGNARNALDVTHGFVWRGGVLRDLGAFPPEDDIGSNSFASAINDSGLIAGAIDLVGVVWDLSGVPVFPPFPPTVRVTDPGPFRPARSWDINNADQVAGTLLADAQGFRWQSATLEPLAVLGGLDDDGLGINELGNVVGRALLAPPVRYHAVLWPDPSTVVDLGTLGGNNSEAFDIDGDGMSDLVLHFRTGETGIQCGDSEAILKGVTFGGQAIQGTDTIATVGCG